MEQSVIYLALVLFGLCFGSFAGATVWRLRARQLHKDKVNGEEYDADEYKHLNKLTRTSLMNDHSRCLDCSYTLKWYDLIPLFSWLSLGGKCRKCRKPIGSLEPLIEIGVAVYFVLSYAFWPYSLDNGLDVTRLIIWLIAGVCLAILFTYDKIWSLLPNQVNFAVIGLGALNAVLVITASQDKLDTMMAIVGSVLILSGLYWLIYIVSRGMWVGYGDVKLGLGLGLLLADWRLAFIALFAANVIGCLIVIPAMIMKKLRRDSHVPFGPLLILGFIIAGLVGNYFINALFLF